jgi:hypothetical protein
MQNNDPNKTALVADPQGDKWLQWKKWIFHGLRPIQPAQNIKKIMEVSDIHEYLQKVQPYQPFQQQFIIYDSEDPKTIRYSYLGHDDRTPTVGDYQHFSALFDINIHQMNTRLHELNVKIAGCEYTLKNHFVQQKSKLKEITTQILTESAILFRHQIEQTIREKTIEFEQHLTGVLDEMIQYVYTAADEAHDTLQTTSQQLVNEFQDKIKEKKDMVEKDFITSLQNQGNAQGSVHSTLPTPPTNPRFPNAQVNMQFCRSANPYETTTSLPDVHP